ncbi:hypothetical protein ACFLXK_03490 [Chloroflexota bacterium]
MISPVKQLRWQREIFDKPDEKNIPVIVRPREHIKVLVCGGEGRNKTRTMYDFYVVPSTKKIELPANWEQLLKGVRE